MNSRWPLPHGGKSFSVQTQFNWDMKTCERSLSSSPGKAGLCRILTAWRKACDMNSLLKKRCKSTYKASRTSLCRNKQEAWVAIQTWGPCTHRLMQLCLGYGLSRDFNSPFTLFSLLLIFLPDERKILLLLLAPSLNVASRLTHILPIPIATV